jgi:adenosylhomocysteine nucleosidase
MEGAAIAHTAFVNGTRFIVIRAISDSADADSSLDYAEFLPIAAENSAKITKALCRKL